MARPCICCRDHPSFRRRGGPWWSLPAIHIERRLGPALASLCENYSYPLYAYLRWRGYPAGQAQDLTQEFFMRVLEGQYLDRADQGKGRFRSFL
jgi:DNA-directed RNA polymerase specialized sigma24 family protein